MSSGTKYPRGSEWRKWDLHLHTPSSYDYKNGSIENAQIIKKLRDNNIAAVAITDHHSIDVNRITILQKLGKAVDITVFPGIEFRSELGGSESVHFIGIFPEDCKLDEIWADIKSQCNLHESNIAATGHEKITCDLKDTCDLIQHLGGIVSIHAGGKSNSLESIKNNHEFKQFLKKDIVENGLPPAIVPL